MKLNRINFRWKCYAIAIFLLFCALIVGIYHFVFDIDMQRCEMTYMFEFPDYQRYQMAELEANASFRWYGLYRYSEGGDRRGELRGTPVLFIPGNSGSYRQVRSLASVSRQISLRRHSHQIFDYFSLDLNGEWSGASGAIVSRQIAFAVAAMRHIGQLYGPGREELSLVLVGHSMGGFVGRAAIAAMAETADGTRLRVRLLLTLAAPLHSPVAPIDSALTAMFDGANERWWRLAEAHLQHLAHLPAVVSLTGGNRDLLVHDRLGRVADALWLPATAVRGVGTSTDHLCILWCRQLVVALNEALFSLAAANWGNNSDIVAAFRHQLVLHRRCQSNETAERVDSLLQLIMRGWREISLSSLYADGSGDVSYCIGIGAASFSSRPLRLRASSPSRQCPPEGVRVSLATHRGHEHRLHIRLNGPSVPLALADDAPLDMAPVLHVELSRECRDADVKLVVWASPVDWLAQFVRVHSWRLVAAVSALVVLRLFGRHDALALLATGAICGLATTVATHVIDGWDVLLLLALGLPLAECVLLLSRIVVRFVAIVTFWRPSIPVFVLPPIITMVLTPHSPVLAQAVLTLSYLVAVSVASKCNSRPINIGAALLIQTLLQAAPSLALWHASLQHQSVGEMFRQWLIGLADMSNYGVSVSFLALAVVCIGSAARSASASMPDAPKSETRSALQTASAVTLASGCLLQGSLDICQCSSYLTAAVMASEMADLVIQA